MNPRVTNVIPNDDYTLTLCFTNGELRKFDVRPLLTKGVFQQLVDLSKFKQARVAYGTVEWPDEIDICPDTLYEEGVIDRDITTASMGARPAGNREDFKS